MFLSFVHSLRLTIRSTGTLDTVQVPRVIVIVIRDRLSGKNITNEVGK